ncbi:oligosaccharyl transferase, archaeosortase A system-associated [Halogeometricum borinquense]|uniref:dolichyl-phosphooligosaccharide-protein glycotransferase n=1 Tax=Halogeometricum borinquense TaxID=60847 RepID=A0A6C0UMT4_9EURY|nr:oligosaccharyl transferase, archaeosortase A system-associated [Halogeometricum borinquense]QIB74238.1 oligosaccharyl transferase, archaeosortase A system-associated [Halogeometricum borinquense]
MSVDNERREDHETTSVLERFEDWYHIPALLVVMVFMLTIRLQSYSKFIRNGEVFFDGNDAWYHLREVSYTVRHWPSTIPFDPWTHFPYGTSVGQFGTLYDQIVATAALVIGLGSPSQELIAKTLLVTPAVFGALTAIPAYIIGKRLAGRGPGVFAAILLGLMPGLFLQRTLVGVSDHNGVEPFFQAISVAALLIAFAVAEKEMPIWEIVAERDFDAIRSSTKWAVIAGVATALYMWVWPPGVLIVGVLGAFVLVKMASDVTNGKSPEPTAFVAAVSMGVTAVLMLVQLEDISFSSTHFSLIQPVLAFAVASGAIFLAWVARQFESRDVDATAYPAAVFGLVLLTLGIIYIALPSLWSLLASNFLRILGFSAGAATRTIGEAQPYLSPDTLSRLQLTPVNRIVADYGFTLFTGIAGATWMLAKPLVQRGDTRDYGYVFGGLAIIGLIFLVPAFPNGIGSLLGISGQLVGLALVSAVIVGAALLAKQDPEHLFVIIWAVFMTSAAFTQLRFHYYLAVIVVVVNAYLLSEVLSFLDVRATMATVTDLELYQVVSIAMVVLLIAAPVLLVPLNVRNTGTAAFDKSNTAWETSQGHSPSEVLKWESSFEWTKENTPKEGTFGGANNEMAYYGSYEKTDDFQYADGSYGILSWWDYGHWITVQGERIPNANPFQEGAVPAANFLLAPNETQAQDVIASQSTEGNNTRYVMVDWKMATPGSKFSAPSVFYDAEDNFSSAEFYEQRVYHLSDEGRPTGNFLVRDQRFYDSMMTRLYYYHGSAQDPSAIVVDWEPRTVQTSQGPVSVAGNPAGNATPVRNFDGNMSAAKEFVEEDGTSQIGGIGTFPEERVPALEHYRLVKVSNSSATSSNDYLQLVYGDARAAQVGPQVMLPRSSAAWVKSFERVPGATVQGSGAPANSTVTASVEMKIPTENSTFEYTQQAQTNEDGEFTMTLPYSTTGYSEYGPDNGYTNVSVRATGPYTISSGASLNESGYIVGYQSNLSVSEGQVNGDKAGDISVELQRTAQKLELTTGQSSDSSDSSDSSESSDSSDTSESSESTDSSSSSDTSDSSGSSDSSDSTDSTTSSSIVVPESAFAAKPAV